MIFLFLRCVSTVIIVYIIISPLNSYLYIHWILDFKSILFLLLYYYCDIYDAMRKMDAADVKIPTYVVDPAGIGRIPKYSPEDLNVVAMDQRIRDLEKRCVTLDAILTMKTSHYDALEDNFNVVKLVVEQHTTRLRTMEHPSKGAKKIHHSNSVVPVQSTSPLLLCCSQR